ncbi:MAG TPA: hypothetical protein VFS62_07910 [Chloroflexota bacterium]|nr:hypothetical protein [Chloroflexota bacterium]
MTPIGHSGLSSPQTISPTSSPVAVGRADSDGDHDGSAGRTSGPAATLSLSSSSKAFSTNLLRALEANAGGSSSGVSSLFTVADGSTSPSMTTRAS